MKKKYISFLTKTSILLSVSIIIGYLESLLPPLIPFLPYFKLGLSNIVLIIAILRINILSAYIISFLKSIIVPLFIGNPSMIMYSLPASIISLSIMIVLMIFIGLGIPTTSIISSITHNFVQILIAYLIMGTKIVFSYLPYLTLISIVSGIITGLISFWIYKSILIKNHL